MSLSRMGLVLFVTKIRKYFIAFVKCTNVAKQDDTGKTQRKSVKYRQKIILLH